MEKILLEVAKKDLEKVKSRKKMRIPDTMFGSVDLSFENKTYTMENYSVVIFQSKKEDEFLKELSKIYKTQI